MRLNSTANTYGGATTISAGTLVLGATGTILNSTPVTISPGALLDATAISTGYTIASGKVLAAGRSSAPAVDLSGNLVLSSGGTLQPGGTGTVGTLTVDGNLTLNGGSIALDRSGSSIDQISLSGASRTLTASGTTGISAVAGYMPAGTYTLISGFGSTTATAANFTYANPTRGQTPTFAVGSSDIQMTLDTGTPGNLTWSGTASTVWDASALNWNAGAEKFYPFDSVTFPDSPVNATVAIGAVVRPTSLTFSNASTAYTMRGGTGSIAGTTSIVKNGAAAVTLWNNANTFTGGTTINAGSLVLNNGAALATGSYTPLGTGAITINGGTFELNPGNSTGGTYTFPNTLNLNGGVLFQNDGYNHMTGLVTVGSATTIRTQYNLKNIFFEAGLAGSAPLTITDQSGNYGNGAVEVMADGTYSGTITINTSSGSSGALVLRANNAMPTASVILESNTADDGYGPTPVGLTLAGGASNVTLAGLSGVNSNSRVWNGDATERTLTINNATDLTYNGRIGGGTVNGNKLALVKNGTGKLTLNGANTYTGATTVNAGTLTLPSSQTGTGAISVNDGATLDVAAVAGLSLAPTSLTLGSSTGATLSIRNFASSPTVAPINAGSLTTNGASESILINVSGTFAGGTYPLIKYTPGSPIGGSGFAALKLGPLPRGMSAILENNPGSGEVDIVIDTVNPLIWTGTNGTNWDIDTSVNWYLVDSLATYHEQDVVVFDDNAGTNTNVILNIQVAPASVTVNALADYTISGTGAITGTTGLTKSNSGTLNLGTANTFSGACTINSGAIVLGNDSALGSVAAGTIVTGDGMLDLNGHSIGGEALSLNGTGPIGNGALLNNSATAATAGGTVTIAGDTGIGGGGSLTLTGVISGNSILRKVGSGTLNITSASTPYPFTGSLVVAEGNLVLGRSGGYGRLFNSNVTIKNGATLTYATDNGFQFYPGVLTVESGGTLTQTSGRTSNIGTNSGTFVMQGGSTLSGAGENYWGSWTINTPSSKLSVTGGDPLPVVVSALNVVAGGSVLNLDVADVTSDATADLLFTGTIGAPSTKVAFGVTVDGGGKVTLSGVNTYVGDTTVNAGTTLELAQAGELTLKPVVNGVTNSIGGVGTALLDGKLNLDLTTTDKTGGNSWLLVNVSTLAVTYGDNFTLPGFAKDGEVWTKVDGGTTWTFTQSTGVLAFVSDPFSTWIAGFGLTDPADRLPGADPDHDGIVNAIEFVLGGNPATGDDSALLPNGTTVSADLGSGMTDYFKFTFRRSAASASLNPAAFYNTDLNTIWTPAQGAPGVVIVPTVDGYVTGIDKVEVYIPRSLSVNGKLFGRLKVTIP
ncbi:MAG: autotransporter-associated beta strand repeat-containing protein [Luteolibacter sp.]